MRRDMDLIRKLVFYVEDVGPVRSARDVQIEGYTPEQIGYHCYLIVDAGYAKGAQVGGLGSRLPESLIFHLTSAGHDFADSARNDTVWNSVKTKMAGTASSVSISTLGRLLERGVLDLLS